MNNKGQVIWFTLMIAVVIVILSLALAPALKQMVDNARNPTSGDTLGMDCDNSSISIFDKSACIATDMNLFYFIIGTLTLAGAVIGARVIISE